MPVMQPAVGVGELVRAGLIQRLIGPVVIRHGKPAKEAPRLRAHKLVLIGPYFHHRLDLYGIDVGVKHKDVFQAGFSQNYEVGHHDHKLKHLLALGLGQIPDGVAPVPKVRHVRRAQPFEPVRAAHDHALPPVS